ncbi:MAG: hypothetical protein WAM42_21120 [Candidatus Nitrosopolaris sp.]
MIYTKKILDKHREGEGQGIRWLMLRGKNNVDGIGATFSFTLPAM